MNANERHAFANDVTACVMQILDKKGNDYGKDNDANANFKDLAKKLGPPHTPYSIWYVFFSKHLASLETWITKKELESEPIEGRLTDLINYLIILWSLAYENGQAAYPKITTQK